MCVALAFCAVFLSACDDPIVKSTINVEAKYQELMADFGDNGFVELSVDSSKVVPAASSEQTDKSYIFSNVYEKYLDCASGFFFYIAKRDGGAMEVIKKYASEKAEELENIFASCIDAVNLFVQEKQVYEQSEGALHYVETVNAMNLVVDRFYSLSTTFADEYFKTKGFAFSTQTKLENCGTAVNDILWFELCALSRISFGYELINFAGSNPPGDTTDWFNSTTTVKSICQTATNMLEKLKAHDDITIYLNATGREQVLICLKNIESLRENFLVEYNSFLQAKHLVDLKTYLSFPSQTQRDGYLDGLSTIQKARYRIVENFMQGKYAAFSTVMSAISGYVAG